MVNEQWIHGYLSDVIDSLVAGVSVNSNEQAASSSYYILKTSAISNGKLNLSEKKPVLPQEIARLKCSLQQGTILISRMNTPELVGECAYVICSDSQIYIPDRIWQTNFKKGINVSAKWLNYLLNSKEYRLLIQNCATGTSNSMKNISKEQLLGLEILYPSFYEQTAIAEVLSDVDSLISSLQKLIEKKKVIKQGAMQELLTGKKRLPGFSGEWKKEKLGITTEINPASGELPETFLYIDLESVDKGKLVKKVILSKEAAPSRAQRYLKDSDVLFQLVRPYQKNNYYFKGAGIAAIASTGYAILREKSIHSGYLYYSINSDYFIYKALEYCTGTSYPAITPVQLSEIELFCPVDYYEQQAIAQVLSDMDSEIEQLEKKLAKYQQIKQGMIQELLTGRIRLVDEESHVQPKTQAVQEKRPQPAHNQHFDDAVMIAGIVNAFYSAKYPLGRKKVQKLLYLVRRKEQADTSAFHKKAAGPYADEVRYKGGEPIARKNQYIQVKRSDKGSCFERGVQMQKALAYLQDWDKQADIDWLVSQFQYTKVNELELLATVDMAICDLRSDGKEVSVSAIKDLIGSNKEWRDKLKKDYFKDTDIQRAIERCKKLFPDKEG